MIWQDIILTAGSFVFIFALVPTLIAPDKPPLSTSIPTAVVLFSFSLTYATLGLSVSAGTSMGLAFMWAIVAKQKADQE